MTDFDPNAIGDIENALSLIQQAESESETNHPQSFNEEDQQYHYDPQKANNHHKDMDQILNNFEKALSNFTEENDSETQQLQDTKYNHDEESLSIGDFKIIKNEDKTYNLLDEDGKTLIRESFLYEAVYNIASYLYQGYSFNSMKVLNTLKLNEKYEKFVTDARMHKHNYNKYKKTGDYDKQEIEKARFDENKTKAISFKRPIVESYKNFKK